MGSTPEEATIIKLSHMYTAQECIEAVKLEQELPPIVDVSPYKAINTAIIEHVNSGWLCLNAARYGYVTRDVIDYYRSLGFRVDKDSIIYWIYQN